MSEERTEAEVASGLLAHLRSALQEPDLAYPEPPLRVTGGFDTMIYSFRLEEAPQEFSGPLILRLFREHDDPRRALWENAVHTAVTGLGYPAPRVLLLCADKEVLGGAFLIMERLPGRMMLEDVFEPSRLLFRLPRILTEVPRILVETQTRLHALDPEPLLRAVDAAGLPASGVGPAGISRRLATVDGQLEQMWLRIERSSLHGLRPGLQWVLEHRPPEPEQRVICHGDFHPLNVLMERETVSGVVDWSLVTVADPAFDVANTKLLLEIAPLELPLVLDWLANVLRPILARRYYDAYRRQRPVDSEAIRYYEALRCTFELVWVAERRLADAGVIEPRSGPNPWGAPRPTNRLIAHFRKISGITLTLPPIA